MSVLEERKSDEERAKGEGTWISKLRGCNWKVVLSFFLKRWLTLDDEKFKFILDRVCESRVVGMNVVDGLFTWMFKWYMLVRRV